LVNIGGNADLKEDKRNQRVGIIAEDDSDVDSARVLIHRIANDEKIGISKCVGKGCGRINRKCHSWSGQLKEKGCSLLILIHDLNGNSNNLHDLEIKIRQALRPCPITIHLICIPVHEFEAWLLSDSRAIKTAMKLQKAPNIKYPPETISAPKEYLGELIYRASNGEKVYMNTRHNSKIAEKMSLNLARTKCPSFRPFYHFIDSNFNC